MFESRNGEGSWWNRLLDVCTVANPILVLILCVVFFLGGPRHKPSRVDMTGGEEDIKIAESSVAGSEHDLAVEYLRTLKPKIDSSTAAILAVQKSMGSIAQKVDLLDTQVQEIAYVVRRVQQKSSDAEHREELLSGFLDRILKALDQASEDRKAITDQLGSLRVRQLTRDIRDIKRAVERGQGKEESPAGKKALSETMRQLSQQIDNLLQEMADIRSYLAQIQKMQAAKRKEDKALHEFLKRYIPSMQDLSTEQ